VAQRLIVDNLDDHPSYNETLMRLQAHYPELSRGQCRDALTEPS
jgi:hypothetical protein